MPAVPTPLTVQQVAMLTDAIQDEYRAEAIYLAVLADLGPMFPFTNIVLAEGNHAASLAQLFRARDLVPPANAWSAATVPHFRSLPDACASAADAEIANIALYDRFLAGDLPQDVRNVFTNNRAASVNNHLPAFTRCR